MRLIRLVASLTVLVPLAVFGSPVATATGDTSAPVPTRVMIVGDSITHGAAGDYTWRYRLWRHLHDNHLPVDFVGPSQRLYDQIRATRGSFVKSEAYADPTLDRDHHARWGVFLGTWPTYRVGVEDTIRADVRVHKPDYLVVMLGLTDLFFFKNLAPAEVTQRMANLVRNAREANPEVKVALVAIPPTLGTQQDAVFAGRIADYNRRISALATATSTAGSPVAYVAPPAGYQPDYRRNPHDTYDGTHPNARGEIRLADSVADVLSTRLGLGPPYPLSLAGVRTGPVLPFTLRCTPGDTKATLTWDESPGATGYLFQRRTKGGAWSTHTQQVTLANQPLNNPYLYNGVTYEFRLQAATMYDKGVYSNVCSVTPGARPQTAR